MFTLAIDQIASYAMMNAGEELKHSASAEKRGGGNGIMETILAPHDREHEHGHEDDISRENLLNHSTDSDGAGRDATADTSMEKAFDRVTAPIRRKSRTTSLDEDIQLYGHNHRHIHVPSDYGETYS